MTDPIAIEHLVKRYGAALAVDDVSLVVPQGSVCGLLGPNGAGKSTTFKCLLGLARPTAGRILFFGMPLDVATLAKLSYVPERPALHEWLTMREHFEIVRRVNPRFDAARAAELAATFKLPGDRKTARLSKGQQTAVALTLAFATRPELLILDEPASGLDPVFQRVVIDLIVDATAGGATTLFSSHQIGQVERAADRIAILRGGKLALAGDLDDLKGSRKVVEAIFTGEAPEPDGLASDPRVGRIVRTGRILRVSVNSDAPTILREVERLQPKTVDVIDVGLEEIFLDAVGAGENGGVA